MIILFIILAIIAIVGMAVTSAFRKGLDKEDYDYNHKRVMLGLVRGAIVAVCAGIAVLATLIGGVKIMDQTEVGIVKNLWQG